MSFTINTRNPSNDDNIFFAAIILGGNTAAVGEGILLSPAAGSAPTGATQTVFANVQATNGTPINGRAVNFKVISGPNVGLTGSVNTNSSGLAVFSYSSLIAGSDTIQACMTNSSSAIQCSNLVVRTWTGTNTVTFSMQLDPSSATNPVGTNHTVTTTISNSSGTPVSGVLVTFTVLSGPNAGLTGVGTTNSLGKASFTYSSASAGTDTIRASANLGGVTQNSNTVSKLWMVSNGNPILSLSPLSATNPINGQHTLKAIAFDGSGNPVSGVTVQFTVLSGPNVGSLGTAVTNSSGVATKSYIGLILGTDQIQSTATISSIATTSNIVSNTWAGLLCDVDGNGQVDNRDVNLVFQARNTLAGPGDVRDVNFDGRIDALDARGCALKCTKLACAQ